MMMNNKANDTMKNVWNDQTTLTFARLLRGKGNLWTTTATEQNSRSYLAALQDVSEKMKSEHINVTTKDLYKKMNELKLIYAEERKQMERLPSYNPRMSWFPIIDGIVNKSSTKGRKSNSNSEHVSSNGDIERSEEDTPTQPNSHTIKIEPSDETIPDETFTGEPHTREDRIIPDDDSTITNHLSEIDVDIQNGSDFPTSRHESMASVRNLLLEQQDPNVRNFPSRGAYDTLTSFTNYLGSLLRHLPLEKCLQLQQKIINLTMNEMNESQQENGNVNLFNQADNRRNRVVPEISIETEPVDVVQGFGVCSENRGMSVQARMHRKSLPSKAPQKRNYSTIQPDAQRESSNREDVPWKRLCQGNQYFD